MLDQGNVLGPPLGCSSCPSSVRVAQDHDLQRWHVGGFLKEANQLLCICPRHQENQRPGLLNTATALCPNPLFLLQQPHALLGGLVRLCCHANGRFELLPQPLELLFEGTGITPKDLMRLLRLAGPLAGTRLLTGATASCRADRTGAAASACSVLAWPRKRTRCLWLGLRSVRTNGQRTRDQACWERSGGFLKLAAGTRLL
mmetsp:Transcript_84128/g.116953  ORF Transcript_84128/g.116953 Transcript_84128/m.116953 type:complete len:201 (+) Transcript_84128:291-893(+)